MTQEPSGDANPTQDDARREHDRDARISLIADTSSRIYRALSFWLTHERAHVRILAFITWMILLILPVGLIVLLLVGLRYQGWDWIGYTGFTIASVGIGFYLGRKTRQYRRDQPTRPSGDGAVEAVVSVAESEAVGAYLMAYGRLEYALRSYYDSHRPADGKRESFVSLGAAIHLLADDQRLPVDDIADIRSLVDLRNRVAHGGIGDSIPSAVALRHSTQRVLDLANKVRELRDNGRSYRSN